MATITVEKVGQQAGAVEASRTWRVHGTTSLAAAEALVQAIIDDYNDTFDGKPFTNFDTTEVERQTWDIRAIYKVPELVYFAPEEEEISLSFSTGGETATLYHPVATRAEGYSYFEDTWEFFIPPGINVDSTGRIQGVEVPIRSFDFTMSLYRDDANVSIEYIRNLYLARNTTNAAEIDIDFGADGVPKVATFYAGELLLADVSGGRVNPTRWQFVFNVRFSENRNGADGTTEVPLSELGFDVGSTGASIKKDGHHYLWVYYTEQEFQNGDDQIIVTQKPVAAFSDKIFFDSDFSVLELPDGA